jgi:hypothetical protein
VRALAVLVAVGALVGGCTGGEDAGPSPEPEATTSTAPVDYTGVVLPGVGGETTTTIDEQGTARLVGTVSGPAGPLAGATVRIDRLVAERVVRHDVITAADGRWELRDAPGGRYRIRAFQPPVYVQQAAELRFLVDGQEHTFDLRVEDQRGLVVRADAAPDQPLVGSPVNVVVLVAQRTVTQDGIVSSTPLSGVFVELTGLGRWVLLEDGTTTDATSDTTSTTLEGGSPDQGQVLSAAGRARFELECVAPGAPRLSLRIPVLVPADPAPPATGGTTTSTEPRQRTEEVALELPECGEPPSTTTSTTTPSSTP